MPSERLQSPRSLRHGQFSPQRQLQLKRIVQLAPRAHPLPPSLLQQEHPPRQHARVDAQVKVEQEAQRDLEIHQLRLAHAAHLGHAVLRPLVVLEGFGGDADGGEREAVHRAACGGDHEIRHAQAVAVGCGGEVHAGRVRAVLVDAEQVFGQGEGGGDFGEEAAGDGGVLDGGVGGVGAEDGDGFVGGCFGGADGDWGRAAGVGRGEAAEEGIEGFFARGYGAGNGGCWGDVACCFGERFEGLDEHSHRCEGGDGGDVPVLAFQTEGFVVGGLVLAV